MSARGAILVLAAAACLCAQACGGRAATRQSASSTAAPTPTPHAPTFPALQRGTAGFVPFVNLGAGRRFEAREVGRKPRREDLEVSADYPVLLGDEGPAAREFNRLARALVLEDVTPYLEARPDHEKRRDRHFKDVKESHHVSHQVVFASDEFVSVLFYVTGYSWGAAHGYHRPVAFNFDLKAGREIKLAGLFRPGSAYLQTLSTLCDEDLRRQFGPRYMAGKGGLFADGLRPKAGNFDSWVVTRDGLVFVFEEYRVASYADGEPKVLIPFEALREIADPRGPLARLAAERP
ncbi:MAG TPA: RsiV family protein [Pyrinomonadaceae bacterium]|jgi:hypothetical protein|nr:RsiV family protein [Pyrinomonadaceae bacterium]